MTLQSVCSFFFNKSFLNMISEKHRGTELNLRLCSHGIAFLWRHKNLSRILWTPIWYVTLTLEIDAGGRGVVQGSAAQGSFAPSQKSRRDNCSCMWTEALSGMISWRCKNPLQCEHGPIIVKTWNIISLSSHHNFHSSFSSLFIVLKASAKKIYS